MYSKEYTSDGDTTKGIKDPRGNKEKIQLMCKDHNIPLYYEINKIKEGWVGKAKSSLQVLFERGWIDPLQIHVYTKKGVKADSSSLATGLKENRYSLDALMQKQEDFKSEYTLLQYHGAKLGVVVERSPKCHPEIAGEGIEYGWALSKMAYRRSPIS